MATVHPQREQFRFWLYRDRDDDARLITHLAPLRAQRETAPIMRAALLLYFDLKAGNLTELEAQFSHAVKRIEDRAR